ncbi:fibroblast growth factor-binding protein 2b [Tachysurus fulvidraco]|uniref:fibroblast growth factor-binding protein 2b n=1 Tax=Tachysurus fulvidraco TaxID=1234273 RepID=UPI000F4FBCD1|nr:fibroblast growth factor-binding protein 2b [Tachysurus fulvidraco]
MRATLQFALLLAGCVWATIAQAQSSNQGNSSHSNPGEITGSDGAGRTEAIRFSNKAKDDCVMVVSSYQNSTKLRVSCKTKGKSYWCDFLGKPNLCRSYSNNPQHYFTQIMWEMRKLQNSCHGLRTYKPQMCRSAADEAQMVFHASWPKIQKQQQPGKVGRASKPKEGSKAVKNPALKPIQPQKPVKTTTQRPTETPKNWADKAAEEHCWEILQGICSYVINWFQ